MFGIGAAAFTCGRWALPFRCAPMRPTQQKNIAPGSWELSTAAPVTTRLHSYPIARGNPDDLVAQFRDV